MGEIVANSLFITSYGRSGTVFALDKGGAESLVPLHKIPEKIITLLNVMDNQLRNKIT